MILRERPLKELIAGWLELTKDHLPTVGLEREEALSRAGELRRQLKERGPDGVELAIEEDTKDVLYGLVELLTESREESPESRSSEATDVYELIRGFPWVRDEFGEKKRLLKKCRELGAVVRRRRSSKRPEPSLEQRIAWTFNDARPFIRLLLLARRGLTESQATEIERTLEVWFWRYCVREGNRSGDWKTALVDAAGEKERRASDVPTRPGGGRRSGKLLEMRLSDVLRSRNRPTSDGRKGPPQ